MALPYHIPKALEPINSKLPSQTCPCPHSSAWAVGHSTTRDTMVKPWDPKGMPDCWCSKRFDLPHPPLLELMNCLLAQSSRAYTKWRLWVSAQSYRPTPWACGMPDRP